MPEYYLNEVSAYGRTVYKVIARSGHIVVARCDTLEWATLIIALLQKAYVEGK